MKPTKIVNDEREWNQLLKDNKKGVITVDRKPKQPTYVVLETDTTIYKIQTRPM